MQRFLQFTALWMFCLSSVVGANGGIDLCLHALNDWHISEELNEDCHHHGEKGHEHSNHSTCSDEPVGISFVNGECRECVHFKIVGFDAAFILSQSSVELPDLVSFESILSFEDVRLVDFTNFFSPPFCPPVSSSTTLVVQSTVFLI